MGLFFGFWGKLMFVIPAQAGISAERGRQSSGDFPPSRE